MEKRGVHTLPHRITDLVAVKKKGGEVTCHTSFEVIPVDFHHRDSPYQAHVFMCYFSGTMDGREYTFRKCYARGCPHNLCPHVSQAVMIANRYLQRDYRTLKEADINVEERLFTLEDMLVRFNGYREEHDHTLTIDDYIHMAKEGNEVAVQITLEYVPAVEHFANYKNSQIFLTAHFNASCLGKKHAFQRCFACCPTEKEKEDKERQVHVANARLREIYQDFDEASIRYEKRFFS